MPTTEYKVYVSEPTLIATIAAYCEENDTGQSELFREAVTEKLEQEDYL